MDVRILPLFLSVLTDGQFRISRMNRRREHERGIVEGVD